MLTSPLVEGKSTQTSRGSTTSPVGLLITEDTKDTHVASSTPKYRCRSFTNLQTRHLFDREAPQNVSKTFEVYRFIDLSILSTILTLLACPDCQTTSIELLDDLSRKNGGASSLHLCCKTHVTYEVNRCYVYAM